MSDEITADIWQPGFLHDHERRIVEELMDVVGSDAGRILDGLHHLAAKLALAATITPESLVAGQQRHICLLSSKN
jgi:hypothetical protein